MIRNITYVFSWNYAGRLILIISVLAVMMYAQDHTPNEFNPIVEHSELQPLPEVSWQNISRLNHQMRDKIFASEQAEINYYLTGDEKYSFQYEQIVKQAKELSIKAKLTMDSINITK